LGVHRTLVALTLITILGGGQDTGWSQEQPATPATLPARLREIAECLAKGNDAVLSRDRLQCVDRFAKHLPVDTAPGVELGVVCSSANADDRRRLSGDAVKQLAAQKQISISPSGIRVFGAIFCDDELDLIGLNLPYSLVLGNSVFKYGIDAHNFHTQ
jgi:hypothetical protein